MRATYAAVNRYILVMASLGALLSIHLWVQKERGFDNGCLGLGAAIPSFGTCDSTALKGYESFVGLSLAVWGYMFYTACAFLAVTKIFMPRRAGQIHEISQFIVVIGMVFSGYLFYVQLRAGAVCPLCVISGILVFLLGGLHVWQRKCNLAERGDSSQVVNEAAYVAVFSMALGLFVPAFVIFGEKAATHNFDRKQSSKEFERMLSMALPRFISDAQLRVMAPDDTAKNIMPSEWVDDTTPFLGKGDIKVMIFLDPNCPHCKGTFALIEQLAVKFGDKARFYVLSRMLWKYSILPTQALELAKADGKYFDLWRILLATRTREKCDVKEIEGHFRGLGMRTENLQVRLEEVAPQVISQRQRAVSAQIMVTPTTFVNGVVATGINKDDQGIEFMVLREIQRLAALHASKSE